MDPVAPLSSDDFNLFEFLCEIKEQFYVGQAAGGAVLLIFLVSQLVKFCRSKRAKKKYEIERTRRYNSIIVTDDDEPFPSLPNLNSAVPRTSTPAPYATWV